MALEAMLNNVPADEFAQTLKDAMMLYFASDIFCSHPERDNVLFQWFTVLDFFNKIGGGK